VPLGALGFGTGVMEQVYAFVPRVLQAWLSLGGGESPTEQPPTPARGGEDMDGANRGQNAQSPTPLWLHGASGRHNGPHEDGAEAHPDDGMEYDDDYDSSDSEDALLSPGPARARMGGRVRTEMETVAKMSQFIQIFERSMVVKESSDRHDLERKRKDYERRSDSVTTRIKAKERAERRALQSRREREQYSLVHLIDDEVVKWENRSLAFAVEELQACVSHVLVKEFKREARSTLSSSTSSSSSSSSSSGGADTEELESYLSIISRGEEVLVTVSRLTEELTAFNARAEQYKRQQQLAAYVEECQRLDQYLTRDVHLRGIRERVRRHAGSGAGLGTFASLVNLSLVHLQACTAWVARDAAEKEAAERLRQEEEAKTQRRQMEAAEQAKRVLEAERRSGAVSVQTAMTVPDADALTTRAGTAVEKTANELKRIVEGIAPNVAENDVQTMLLKGIRVAAACTEPVPASVAVGLAEKLRDQPVERQMRQFFRSLCFCFYPLCVPIYGSSPEGTGTGTATGADVSLDESLRVLGLLASVMKSDADAWNNDALDWLHRAAATLHALSVSKAAHAGTHFSSCCRALSTFLSINFELVQAKDPQRTKAILGRINRLTPPEGHSEAGLQFETLTDRYTVTPQSVAQSALRACRARRQDFLDLDARVKVALADDHVEVHGSAYNTPGCQKCADKQALRGRTAENDLAFKIKFGAVINPCLDKDPNVRRNAVKNLVEECSLRLRKAQERSNKHYNYALNSMFDSLIKSLFRAKDDKNNTSAASAAEFLRYLSVGYADVMSYARGQLLVNCPVLIPDFDAIARRDTELAAETRHKGLTLTLTLTLTPALAGTLTLTLIVTLTLTLIVTLTLQSDQ